MLIKQEQQEDSDQQPSIPSVIGGDADHNNENNNETMNLSGVENTTAVSNQNFQLPADMLPVSLMSASSLQQQLSALSGLTNNNNGMVVAPMMANSNNPSNLINMGAAQGYLMQQQLQQNPLFQNGFPQGLSPQFFQQQQDPATNQLLANYNQQQLAQAAMFPNQQFLVQQQQLPQQGANQIQQLQQLIMAQQMLAAQQQQQSAGMMMPTNHLSAALYPSLANLMGNPALVAQPSMISPWLGLGMQQQQLSNQAGTANAMNLLLSGLPGGVHSSSILPPAVAAASTAMADEVQPSSEWADPFIGKGRKEPPFSLKLHQILTNPEFADCIAWNAHGRSWRILKPPAFEQIVIPLYFR